MTDACKTLKDNLGSLFHCKEMRNDLIRIRTPFSYPDGDLVDLFLENDGSKLTDLGETLRWLRMQSVATRRTVKQKDLIQRTCDANGFSLNRGAIEVSLRHGDVVTHASRLAELVLRLAQACVRISDVWFTYRTRSIISVADEVADFLGENDISFERDKKFVGNSGREVSVDFHVLGSDSLIQVLATASSAATYRIIDHTVRVWLDVGHTPSKQITLVDDSSDVWMHNEVEWLQSFSDVVYWSQPQTLLNLVAA